MPDPSTTRLALYKSKSDGSELVNYTQDIGQNLDKIDAAVGFQAATSSTRPSSPYSGKAIMETDTSYRTYFSNGTSPASASWVQIPNSSSTFNADLDLTSGKQVNIGGSSSVASVAVLASATGDDIISTRLSGDTQSRFLIEADGAIFWGAGGASAADVKLYRSAADTLKTDDSLIVGTNLTVSGSGSITGALAVTGNLTVSGLGQRLWAHKAGDTARTTGTGDDPDLTFAVAANAVYKVHGVLRVNTTDAANADINVDWTVPTGAGGFWVGIGQPTTASGTDGTVRTQGSTIDASRAYGAIVSAGNELAIVIDAVLITTNAGTYALNWSRTGGSGTLTVMTGSFLELIREA